MDYDAIFATQLNQLKEDGNYRIFAELERQSGAFPKAKSYDNEAPNEVTVWCSNDYLGMGQNPIIQNAMKEAIDSCGCGAGGTRNISGNNHLHLLLEKELYLKSFASRESYLKSFDLILVQRFPQ